MTFSNISLQNYLYTGPIGPTKHYVNKMPRLCPYLGVLKLFQILIASSSMASIHMSMTMANYIYVQLRGENFTKLNYL